MSKRSPGREFGMARRLLAAAMLVSLSCSNSDDRAVRGESSAGSSDATTSSTITETITGTGGPASTAETLPVNLAEDGPTCEPEVRIEPLDGVEDTAPADLDEIDFPVQIGTGRLADHLVDKGGRPVLVHGDAAWSMLVQLTPAEADHYLRTRRDQHFNTVIVELVESTYADDRLRNASGFIPFSLPGDLSTPDPDYFDAAHAVIEQARDLGFLVLLYPMYVGFANTDEGFARQLAAAGEQTAREYGRFVGERFADLDNVIWVHGGDDLPGPAGLALVEAVRAGIVAAGAGQLHTAHWSREVSASDADVDWLDINTTYTGGPVYVASLEDDALPLPHLLIEAQYENDRFDNTAQLVRAQAYTSMLSGSSGSVFGNGIVWPFLSGWPDELASTGARDMTYVRLLFESLPWFDLVPDAIDRRVVREPGAFGTGEFTVAASTPDGAYVVAYQPVDRAIRLDPGCGAVLTRWYDPTSGRFVAASTEFDAEHLLVVDHPGTNADGDVDWVLTVRVER